MKERQSKLFKSKAFRTYILEEKDIPAEGLRKEEIDQLRRDLEKRLKQDEEAKANKANLKRNIEVNQRTERI